MEAGPYADTPAPIDNLPDGLAQLDDDDPPLRFVYLILDQAGGWVTDTELRESTGYSQPTISRVCRALQGDDLALRRRRPANARIQETRLIE